MLKQSTNRNRPGGSSGARNSGRSGPHNNDRNGAKGGMHRVQQNRNRTKTDPFDATGMKIDYKNPRVLLRFTSERGKIFARRLTGVTAKNQRKLSNAIKRARYLALLPFVAKNFNFKQDN